MQGHRAPDGKLIEGQQECAQQLTWSAPRRAIDELVGELTNRCVVSSSAAATFSILSSSHRSASACGRSSEWHA